MTANQARGIALQLQKIIGDGRPAIVEQHHDNPTAELAKLLEPAPAARVQELLPVIQRYGFQWRRFARTLDYFTNPWETGLEKQEGFTPPVIAEYFYRCAEIHEDGEFKPLELCLRRPARQVV